MIAPQRAQAIAQTLRVDHVTVAAASALTDAGIEFLLLKGPSIARLLYADGVRTYLDTDLLVRPHDVAGAVAALRTLGFVDELAAASPLEQAFHSVTLRDSSGLEIDLHRTLAGATVPDEAACEVLLRSTTTVDVLGTEVPCSQPPGVLLQVALHAVHHGEAGVQQLEDLDRAVTRVGESTWRAAVELAEEIGAVAPFAAGLRLVPAGRRLAAALDLPQELSTSLVLESWSTPRAVHELARLRGAVRVRYAARKIVPTPTRLRLWTPIASRGALGLVVAYLLRLAWVLWQAPRALVTTGRAYLHARRSRRRRDGDA